MRYGDQNTESLPVLFCLSSYLFVYLGFFLILFTLICRSECFLARPPLRSLFVSLAILSLCLPPFFLSFLLPHTPPHTLSC